MTTAENLLGQAEQAVRQLETAVALIVSGAPGADPQGTLVHAGGLSVLLTQAGAAAQPDQTLRIQADMLRGRYDSAMTRLGVTVTSAQLQPAPGHTPPSPPGYAYGIPVFTPIAPGNGSMAFHPGYAPPPPPYQGPVGTHPAPPAPPAPSAPPPTPKPRRRLKLPPELLRPLLTALTVAGGLLLAFSLYASWFGHLTYERNQRIMLDQLNEDLKISATIAAAPVAGDKDLSAVPKPGTPVSLLEIPKIGLREVVVQGTGTAELRSAVGHYRPSPMPGQIGNAVLAGHRNLYGRPFARMGELQAGDKITASSQEGRFTYTVETVQRARTGEQDFLSQATFVNRMTLLTTGDTEQPGGRLAVVARLDGRPAGLKILDQDRIKEDELGLGRDPGGWLPSIVWGLVTVGVLFVTILLYRRWRTISAYLLTTPPLLVAALLWFESVARLIPSTY
ncbi:sortase [Nonomuraea endophytica]|uniref:sortase n=1 Tax=Nonomuraea endophytica TaxID=714136 RepID=UPI0037CBA700